MKKFVRTGAMFIALTLLFSGCVGPTKESGGTNHKKGEFTISDKLLPLTIHMHFFNYCVFDDEWPIFKEAERLTNVSLKGTASESISDSSQAFSTMIAGGKLADIIHYSMPAELLKIGAQGALIPLEDLIKKHAPNIEKFFNDYPEARMSATAADGHIYFIPGTMGGEPNQTLPSVGYFIRQDWLDILGLDEPKTVDDYYNVLKAFKERDPNGNGRADEIPYFNRQKNIDYLLQLFCSYNDFYVDSQGDIQYGKAMPEYKEAIKNLAKWYSEGLIDPEIYSRGEQARDIFIGNNTGGSTQDWFASTSALNDKYSDKVPGLNFVAIPPPANTKGEIKQQFSRGFLHSCGWGISKTNKNPVETIKYMDFWMTDKGTILQAFGVEGIHHDLVDGKPVYKEEVANSPESVPGYMRNQGCVEIGKKGSLIADLSGMNEIGRNGIMMYLDNGYSMPMLPTLNYLPEEEKKINAVMTNLLTYVSERQQRWVIGVDAMSDDSWSDYIVNLKNMGLDEVLEAKNIAYKRYISRN